MTDSNPNGCGEVGRWQVQSLIAANVRVSLAPPKQS